jgi:hypothetical protein
MKPSPRSNRVEEEGGEWPPYLKLGHEQLVEDEDVRVDEAYSSQKRKGHGQSEPVPREEG